MLPWAPGTVAGGSYGERAEGLKALIAPEHPQVQPQTPPSCSHTAWRGLPRPHSHGDSSSPCPLVPCCDAAWREQLCHCLPHPSTAHLCLFAHCKEKEGSSNFGKCRTTTINSPEVRTSAFTTPMSLSCTAPQQVPLLTSTCSFQLLPLPILTVRINLQKKCHRKPHEKLQIPCLAPHNPEEKGHCQPCWFPQFPRVQLV